MKPGFVRDCADLCRQSTAVGRNPANVSDIRQTAELLHGQESDAAISSCYWVAGFQTHCGESSATRGSLRMALPAPAVATADMITLLLFPAKAGPPKFDTSCT